MNTIVLVKQVPDETRVKLDPGTGNLIREGIDSIINPDDIHALEAAVTIKEIVGGTVTVMTMGPPQAVDALTEAMGMGADRGILLTDTAFSGADTWATSFTLSMGIKASGPADLIICGRQAIDGDTAQIGPQVADWLDISQVTCVSGIESVKTDGLTLRRLIEHGFQRLTVRLPVLITVVSEINRPRSPHVGTMIKACRSNAPILVWNAADIGVEVSQVGLAGSLTHVLRTTSPDFKRKNRRLEGTPREAVSRLIECLRKSDTTLSGRFSR